MFMRKLSLLSALFFLVLTSCQEEAPAPQTLSEQIKGSWLTLSQNYKYYDENGELAHEETKAIETVFGFDEFQVTTTYGTGSRTQCFYTLFEEKGKHYVQLTVNGSLQKLEIASITGAGMCWRGRSEKVPYMAGSTIAEADHALVTIEVTRQ